MARPPMSIGLDFTSCSILWMSFSVSVDQSESQDSELSPSLSLDILMTESVEWSESCSSKSKNFLAKLNFCNIIFLAILKVQDATALFKAMGKNEIPESSRVGFFPGSLHSAAKSSVDRADST